MKGTWTEWEGCGDIPDGKVDVMFRDGEVIEASESSCWDWQWYTGDHATEIVGYRQVGDKTPKVERKRPEFTFDDGVNISFECMAVDMYLLPFLLRGRGANKMTLQMLQAYLKRTRRHNCYTYKPLRKKLKLYVKWLQSSESVLECSR